MFHFEYISAFTSVSACVRVCMSVHSLTYSHLFNECTDFYYMTYMEITVNISIYLKYLVERKVLAVPK